jgi:hypothetical protein
LFYDELLRNMVAAMAKAQNSYVNGILISGATLDATTVATYPTAAELLGIVGRGAASVYGATAGLANPFARNMIVSTGQWSNLMTLNDAGRPIYSQVSQPSNQPGVAIPTSLTGNVAGLNLYVDPTNGGDGDGTILSSTQTLTHGTKELHTSCEQNQPLTVQSRSASIHLVRWPKD